MAKALKLVLLHFLALWETSPEPFRLLTIKEAAEVLCVNPETVKSLIRRSELPARKVGGRWRISESVLAKWLEGLNKL
jgi:excisionase family DNA binding protein